MATRCLALPLAARWGGGRRVPSAGIPCLASYRSAARGFAAASGVPRILQSDVQDIVFHFAAEEYLMNATQVTGPLMYLWRPGKVVSIGRHQNPWKECKLAEMEADGVGLVRRRTGGGCVFQDPGGSIFTFLSPSGEFSIDRNLDIVLGALRRCGIDGEKKGRNDLTYQDKKISGSAFRHAPDRGVSLHHGTILVDSDMQALQRYLTPDKRKLAAKGISSVGARVMNLRESFSSLNHDVLCEAFVAEFREVYGAQDVAVETLNRDSPIAAALEFKAVMTELQSSEWRLGRTPDFSHQLETRIDGVGVLDFRLEVVGGKIQEAVIFSDALFPDVIDQVMVALQGADYGRHGIRAALEPLRARFTEDGPRLLLDSLTEWMAANVDD